MEQSLTPDLSSLTLFLTEIQNSQNFESSGLIVCLRACCGALCTVFNARTARGRKKNENIICIESIVGDYSILASVGGKPAFEHL